MPQGAPACESNSGGWGFKWLANRGQEFVTGCYFSNVSFPKSPRNGRLRAENYPNRGVPRSVLTFWVRQTKPGKEEWIDLKPFLGPSGCPDPPGKAGQPSGSESWVVGQPSPDPRELAP
jgi:hypothetical protein